MRSPTYFYGSGFTLIELLVTISLGMVLVTVAVPSFSSFIKNGRLTTVTNDLAIDINYARSEAVTRGARVILCRSSNSTAAIPSCSGTNNVWSSGWLIFKSNDTNNVYNDGVDTLLRIHPGVDSPITIKTNDVSKLTLIYTPEGALDSGGTSSLFAVCDNRGEGYGNQFQISATGRPRLISPVPVSCATPS